MFRHFRFLSAFKMFALVASVVAVDVRSALAHETDQHTVPEGRKFADVGPLLGRWHYKAIRNGVNRVNAEIKAAINSHASDADLRRLQDPDRLVRAVNHSFPWAMDVIDGWDDQARSEKWADEFPGYVVAYKEQFANIYRHTHVIIDPRQFFRLFLAANLKAYGHYIGTDKIGHFTDEGMNYYNVWHKARTAGDDEKKAVEKAIFLGTDDFIFGEKGMLGLVSAGDYSNGDLIANWLGFAFYRNLSEPWPLAGKVRPAMCVRDGPYWKIAPHVRIDSDFFQVYVTDAEDEALNPGFFEPGMRNALRAAIRERREAVLEHYVDEHGCRRSKRWFDDRIEEFRTYSGAYYGHAGRYDELVSIGNTLYTAATADDKVDARDPGGMCPLHTAAWAGDAAVVRALIAHGADVTAAVRSSEKANADWGNTPLHYAVATGNAEVVKLLLAAGANVNASNALGVTPLHRAIRSAELTRLLIDRGAKVDASDARGRTPLHWAACDSENCGVAAGILIVKGCPPDARDHDGRTPLHLAADAGRDAVASELLRVGAAVDATDLFNETPLHLAAAHQSSPMTALLLRSGAKVNPLDDFGCTALHDAARGGALDNVTLLLNAGASPSTADAFGATPARIARDRGYDNTAAALTANPLRVGSTAQRPSRSK